MERLGVHLDGKEIYDIVITDSFDGLKEEVGRLRTEGKKLCIVTDSHVEKLYLEEVKERLSKVCRQVDVFVFPAGEETLFLQHMTSLSLSRAHDIILSF